MGQLSKTLPPITRAGMVRFIQGNSLLEWVSGKELDGRTKPSEEWSPTG